MHQPPEPEERYHEAAEHVQPVPQPLAVVALLGAVQIATPQLIDPAPAATE